MPQQLLCQRDWHVRKEAAGKTTALCQDRPADRSTAAIRIQWRNVKSADMMQNITLSADTLEIVQPGEELLEHGVLVKNWILSNLLLHLFLTPLFPQNLYKYCRVFFFSPASKDLHQDTVTSRGSCFLPQNHVHPTILNAGTQTDQ